MKLAGMGAERFRKNILILCLLFIPVTLFSQNNTLLQRRITVSFSNTTLEKLLIHLSNEAGFNFSYNAMIIDVDTPVTVNAENSTVEEVLEAVLGDDISYRVSGNHLILLKELPSEDRAERNIKYQVTGKIYDKVTGQILANVSVYDANKLISTLSDSTGSYSITLTSKYEQLNLFYSKRHFADTLVIVQPADQELNVGLHRIHDREDMDKMSSRALIQYEPVEEIGIVRQFVPREQIIRVRNIDQERTRFAQVSILPNIGTNLKMSGLVENKVSLNVFAGYALGVDGLEVGGLVNIDRKNVRGLQMAGLGNIVGGSTRGVQLGGIFNNNRRNMTGVQVAGISNMIMDTIQGAQVAGISNVLRGSMYGWQVAGINNFTTGNVDGVQMAGISNITLKDVDVLQMGGVVNLGRNVNGFQVSGLINVATEDVGGWQIAGLASYARNVNMSQLSGLANIAVQEVRGLQLAGIINYARYVKGSQVGLFNYADSVGGIPIGLISIVRRGYWKLEISSGEVLYANLTLKLGVRQFHNIFTAGIQPGGDKPVWGFGYGFGTEIGRNNVVLNLDLKGTQIMENVEEQNFNVTFRFTPALGIRLFTGVSFFIGPSINLHVSDLRDPETGEFLTTIAPRDLLLWENVPGTNTLFQLWAGGIAGIRFF